MQHDDRPSCSHRIRIDRLWDGAPAPPSETAQIPADHAELPRGLVTFDDDVAVTVLAGSRQGLDVIVGQLLVPPVADEISGRARPEAAFFALNLDIVKKEDAKARIAITRRILGDLGLLNHGESLAPR